MTIIVPLRPVGCRLRGLNSFETISFVPMDLHSYSTCLDGGKVLRATYSETSPSSNEK